MVVFNVSFTRVWSTEEREAARVTQEVKGMYHLKRPKKCREREIKIRERECGGGGGGGGTGGRIRGQGHICKRNI